MVIRNLLENTKANERMLAEYERAGKDPIYIYIVKEGKFLKGLSPNSDSLKEDEIINSKILLPYRYSNKSSDKDECIDALFDDFMKNQNKNKKYFKKAEKMEGLEQSNFIYRTFIDEYRNRHLGIAKKRPNKLRSKYFTARKKALLLSSSVLLLGVLTFGDKCSKENKMQNDNHEKYAPAPTNSKEVGVNIFENVSEKISQLKEKINNKNSVNDKDNNQKYDSRFNEFYKNLIGEEGGYGTNDKEEIKQLREKGIKVSFIDQPTNFGISQTILNSINKNPKSEYKNVAHVRDLTPEQAKSICFNDYYKKYKINEVKDNLLAEQMFDIMFNHSYKTGRNNFIIMNINKVEKSHNKNHKDKKFESWSEIVAHVNGFDKVKTAELNEKIAITRYKFMTDGRVNEFTGIIKRAKKFVNFSKQQLKTAQQDKLQSQPKGRNSR